MFFQVLLFEDFPYRKKAQNIATKSFDTRTKISPPIRHCKTPNLDPDFEGAGCRRYLLQCEDLSGNGPHLVPGFFVRIPGCTRNGFGLHRT